jgi:hypothetical protein
MPIQPDEVAAAKAELEALPNWNARVALLQTAAQNVDMERAELRRRVKYAKALILAVKAMEDDEGGARAHFLADGGAQAWNGFKARVNGYTEPE